MRIVFDRGSLRLHVETGDTLHSESLEIWREACALGETCINALPSDEADTTCRLLAETATHALTAGRDDRVIADFRNIETRIRAADDALRTKIADQAVATFLVCLAIGFAAGIVWILVEPYAPWSLLPHGLDLAANYILLVLGWAGFTLVGFSIGWLFSMTAVVRIQDRAAVVKQATSLRQRKAHVVYNTLVCLIIVIAMFFFGGFEQINEELSQQLISAPWAILLGIVVGVAEPALFERVRDFFKLS
ncbi:hypothetical protein [Sinorhizobium meliloti]|uniref:hypothetical protein n=1 Tax=Rhizobium meliloti TaxID=382 RepID=UPI000B49CBB3|nr:hypothetical protein [Sinorhizobium meliloti]ASP54331.1 hypothetical protein CDO31_23030 [Sinorhizobium meliloti]